MLALRCTKRVLDQFGICPQRDVPPFTTALGEWYVNLVPMCRGALVVFVSERSLVTVATPLSDVQDVGDLAAFFVIRVRNLFGMLRVSEEAEDRELCEMMEIRLTTTNSKKVLGNLNDLGHFYQTEAEDGPPGAPLGLSDIELKLCEIPQRNIGWKEAAHVAGARTSSRSK